MRSSLLFCSWLAVAAAWSLPAPDAHAVPHRRSNAARATSTSTATNPRASWLPGYDLDTNYFNETPDTGVTREYFFEITNTTGSPDGRERIVMLVNGQLPGPTIEANWGDWVKVHVTNKLENNGTSIHFHGVRQLDTNQNDGVTSVTQCPVAPGQSYTYLWRASEYGSSWYHSHFSLQAWDGIFGGIVINGPASADYDEDVGSFFLNDWNPYTVDAQYVPSLVAFVAPQMDNGLLNGTNTFTQSDGTTVGKRLSVDVASGKRYRLRLVNAAVHSTFRFSIDNHNMTVISSDFTPIVPYTTTSVIINMGQRYDVIIEANQPADNYWMRAYPVTQCSNNTNPENIKGILRYGSYSTADPTTSAWPNQDYDSCIDEPYSLLTPWVKANVPQQLNVVNLTVGVQQFDEDDILWTIDSKPFNNTWDNPMLKQVTSGGNFSGVNNVLTIDDANSWTALVFNNDAALPHPMHLHGHDFWILGTGTTPFDGDTAQFNYENPPHRDTVTMPLPGWVAFAFPADNPGVWLLHCHIGFHTTAGLAMQIVERQGEIAANVDTGTLDSTCAGWDQYTASTPGEDQDQTPDGPFDDGV